MSKIALIQPIVETGKTLRVQKAPTGLQSIAAALEKAGHTVQMFHTIIDNKLIRDILNFNPEHIGFSTMTANFLEAKDIAKRLKEKIPAITIILGGWHASGCVNSYLKKYETWSLKEILNPDSSFDFVIAGEGELVIPRLIEKLNSGKPFNNLKGVGYLNDGNIIVSKAERVKNLDNIKLPSWKNLDISKYTDLRTGELDISIHSQRGCRFNCTYCATPTLYPGKQERMSPKKVIRYIKFISAKFSPSVITFTDEDFMANPEWVDALCNELISSGLNQAVKFDSFSSVYDILKFDKLGILKKMKKAGFKSYFVGIESLNHETLNRYNRPCKNLPIEKYLHEIQKAINASEKAGILFFGDYMIGAPWESEEKVREGFDKLTKLEGMRYVYLPICTPMPGTGLWKEAIDNNWLKQENGKINWRDYNCSIQATKLPYNAIELRNELEISLYTTKTYITWMQKDIKKNPGLKDSFYLPFLRKLSVDHPADKRLQMVVKTLERLECPK